MPRALFAACLIAAIPLAAAGAASAQTGTANPTAPESPAGTSATAQRAPTKDQNAAPQGAGNTRTPSSPDPGAELVEELMTSDPEDDDLGWLYSSADEYTPSRLTGKPIPTPDLPQRGEGSPRVWDPRWRKFGLGHYVLTGTAVAAAAGALAIPPTPSRWRTRNSLDEWGRENLAVQDYDEALWARDLSDVLVSLNVSYPFLVDSLIVMYWYRRSPEVAEQMALITLEALAVSAALQGLTSGLASRERPFVRDCGKTIDPELDDCLENDRFRSFFSGHSANAFAGASVSCSHHVRHDVFGDPAADALSCGIAYASASTVALMRVMGQRHYVSDVVVGGAIGTLSGLGVPWLLHYGPLARLGNARSANEAGWNLLPMPNGLAVGGRFF